MKARTSAGPLQGLPASGVRAGTRVGEPLSLGRAALSLALVAPLFLPAKACTAVYLVLLVPLLWRAGLPSSRWLQQALLPFALLFLLGTVARPSEFGSYAWLQDAWRLLKPVLCLLLGFTAVHLARRRPFPEFLAAVGLVYALGYLARLAFLVVRDRVGPLALADTLVVGHFPEALTLGLALRYRRLGASGRSAWGLRRSAFLVAGLALVLSGSRTWILAGGVMLIAGAGWLRARGRWRAALLALALVGAVGITPFGTALFTRGFDVAMEEIRPARYQVLGDVHDHWRGYEAWRALRSFSDATPRQEILGQGLGAQVDLGLTIELGGVDFREIGQLHNGLLWILVKTGIVGVALFVVWFVGLLGLWRRLARDGKTDAADLLLGVVLTLALTTLVVSGPFNPLSNDALLLVLGGFLALAQRTSAGDGALDRPGRHAQGTA